uniref:Uncharacterized protein n=1 Tax=Rhizophora mucronata TaxID=61149 RepID=A0A2P2IKB8_RHIMU
MLKCGSFVYEEKKYLCFFILRVQFLLRFL